MRFGLFAAILILSLSTLSCCCAGDSLPWQIGKENNNWAEFGLAGRYEAYKAEHPGGATFEVGKAVSEKDWLYIQPGPDAKWAGEGEHPYEVIFFIDNLPEQPLLLKINLIDVSPDSPCVLRVRVNSKVKSFDLQPGASAASLTDPSKGRKQSIIMYVAPGFLTKGRNVINLTLAKGEWVLYDNLSLSSYSDVPRLADDLVLQPTYLFKQKPDGLKQIVYCSADIFKDQKAVHTELVSEDGWRIEQVFDDVASGSRNLEVEIPPVDHQQKAHLKMTVGNEIYETDGMIHPQKLWRIYLLPSSHFDYGYTNRQDDVMKLHRANLDRAIGWCEQYPDYGWELEGSFIAEDYLKNGSQPQKLLDLAKQGRIGVMGFYTNTITGTCSGEELSRVMDYYDFLRNQYGIESKCVMENDIPTMVATVPMILNGHGIKYIAQGTNPVRAGRQNLSNTPYYWESPDGSKVLVYKTLGSYAETYKVIGLDGNDSPDAVLGRVNSVINDYVNRKDYPYDSVLLHGAMMDNVANDDMLARVPDKWNRKYAYPKITICRGREFFEHIESNFAKYIPTVKGDGGVWWEDGAASSALETSKTRLAKETLVAAEKLISLTGKGSNSSLRKDLAEAWKNVLLYDEHTWGASESVFEPQSKMTLDQWAVKKGFADSSQQLSSKLINQAMDALCSGIKTNKDSLVVFNPSSWARSEWIDFKDAKGNLRTLFAESVPALGYKVCPITASSIKAEKLSQSDNLDNKFYTIRFNKSTGAIMSIYDKQIKRELVDPSKYELNSYIYVTGGDRKSWGAPDDGKGLKVALSGGAYSFEKLSLPGRQVMRVTLKAPMAKSFSYEVTLYDNAKRIDICNKMNKIENYDLEACYFAFPFAFKNPNMRIEIPDGVIRPETDQFQGACRDWYAVQSFMTISDNSAAVALTPIDSPMVTLQDINRGHWYEHLKIENGNVFAYVMNNYWFTNYKAAQGGDLTFRFSLTSAKSLSDIKAREFGEAALSPMAYKVIQSKPGKNAAAPAKLIEINGSGAIVQAIAPARFSNGTIIRLREMNGKAVNVSISPKALRFKNAYECNLAEDKLRKLPVKGGTVTIKCKPLGLTSVLLEP